jgi:hypothetical protein
MHSFMHRAPFACLCTTYLCTPSCVVHPLHVYAPPSCVLIAYLQDNTITFGFLTPFTCHCTHSHFACLRRLLRALLHPLFAGLLHLVCASMHLLRVFAAASPITSTSSVHLPTSYIAAQPHRHPFTHLLCVLLLPSSHVHFACLTHLLRACALSHPSPLWIITPILTWGVDHIYFECCRTHSLFVCCKVLHGMYLLCVCALLHSPFVSSL